ncbi:hypothetical protein ONZ51_g13538 [Trametes cubensis]|uniref:Uncharacterized protein n=1 Tax=Trametes cubensis TaxID=1111947 RepID=A0AAD7TF55_9APHY|nr:hypothetical protein ONZ51_g13538 [Trametes cubensis]
MPASTATARVEYLLVIKAIRYVSREFGRIETDSPTQDGPITRRDIDRVVEAVHGVSTEVRALANHVVQAVQPSRRAQTASQGRDQDPDEDGDDKAEEAMAHMSGRRSKGLAKHRSSAQMKLHKSVMQHTLALMGRESAKSPFPEASVAKAQIVRGWRREEGECCTVQSFCLDLSATPGSEWNQSATNVFVNDFIDVGTYECKNRKLIRHAFMTHFRTIKRQYDRQCADAAAASRGAKVDRSAANREKAKEQRKYNSHQRRLYMSLWYPELRKFAPLLRALGPDGMSSDEGEYVNGILHHYRIFLKLWRHPQLVRLLRILDALYRRFRSSEGQGEARGNRPHLRYLSQDESANTLAVPGLPQNAYEPAWLAALRPLPRQDLQVDENDLDFSIDPEIELEAAPFLQATIGGQIYV